MHRSHMALEATQTQSLPFSVFMNFVLNIGLTLWKGESPLNLPSNKYLYISSSVAEQLSTTKCFIIFTVCVKGLWIVQLYISTFDVDFSIVNNSNFFSEKKNIFFQSLNLFRKFWSRELFHSFFTKRVAVLNVLIKTFKAYRSRDTPTV